jgi:hypothetical protein
MLTHNSPPCHSALLRRRDQIASFIFPLSDRVGNIQFWGNSNNQSALRAILFLGALLFNHCPIPRMGAHSFGGYPPPAYLSHKLPSSAIPYPRIHIKLTLFLNDLAPNVISPNFDGNTRLRRLGPAGLSVGHVSPEGSATGLSSLSSLSSHFSTAGPTRGEEGASARRGSYPLLTPCRRRGETRTSTSLRRVPPRRILYAPHPPPRSKPGPPRAASPS